MGSLWKFYPQFHMFHPDEYAEYDWMSMEVHKWYKCWGYKVYNNRHFTWSCFKSQKKNTFPTGSPLAMFDASKHHLFHHCFMVESSEIPAQWFQDVHPFVEKSQWSKISKPQNESEWSKFCMVQSPLFFFHYVSMVQAASNFPWFNHDFFQDHPRTPCGSQWPTCQQGRSPQWTTVEGCPSRENGDSMGTSYVFNERYKVVPPQWC